jgi:hypothetical protein
MRYVVINTDNEYAEHIAAGKKHSDYRYQNYVLETSSCCGSLDEAITRVNTYADYELSMQTDPIILKHKTLKGVYGALGYRSDDYYYGRVTDPASRPNINVPPLDKHYIVNLIIEETSPWFNCAPGDNTPIGEIFTNPKVQTMSLVRLMYEAYTEHVGKVLLNKNNYYTP